jgi:hypothetical protein
MTKPVVYFLECVLIILGIAGWVYHYVAWFKSCDPKTNPISRQQAESRFNLALIITLICTLFYLILDQYVAPTAR